MAANNRKAETIRYRIPNLVCALGSGIVSGKLCLTIAARTKFSTAYMILNLVRNPIGRFSMAFPY
eukprot:SAG31_NODE_1402_length_8494_cov_4.344848_1_plen_65_part_00